MARGKNNTPKRVDNLIRQIENAFAKAKTTPPAYTEAGITEQTYYGWR